MSRGFLIFAFNNEQIDYTEIALVNARMIRANSDHPNVTLVTDQGSLDWLYKKHGAAALDSAFDRVRVREPDTTKQVRRYNDTLSTSRALTWKNGSRASAYDLSLYDETILIDADYLVQDRSLDHCWGSAEPFMINREAVTLQHDLPASDEVRVEPMGISLYWATCIYFRKSPEAERMFGMVDHVRENYDYYRHLYRFPGSMFRNDYAFSIAAHLMGGWSEGGVPSLPVSTILTSFDRDELIDAGPGYLTFLVAAERGFRLNRVEGVSVHVMNKFSIGRMASKLLEAYR